MSAQSLSAEQELRDTIGEERFRAALGALTDQGVNSPGHQLIDLADSALIGVDEIDLEEPYPEDQCAEIADGAVPMMNADILEAISEDLGLAHNDPECGPAFDGSPTPINIAAGTLYELASNIAHARLQERREEAEEDEDE